MCGAASPPSSSRHMPWGHFIIAFLQTDSPKHCEYMCYTYQNWDIYIYDAEAQCGGTENAVAFGALTLTARGGPPLIADPTERDRRLPQVYHRRYAEMPTNFR